MTRENDRAELKNSRGNAIRRYLDQLAEQVRDLEDAARRAEDARGLYDLAVDSARKIRALVAELSATVDQPADQTVYLLVEYTGMAGDSCEHIAGVLVDRAAAEVWSARGRKQGDEHSLWDTPGWRSIKTYTIGELEDG